ncbi:MAG TPA: hypothetical protein GX707_11745 [Epulopiscium sp.]|nr:hypothetical protein [Candidatus Epulonipiscium sp.]
MPIVKVVATEYISPGRTDGFGFDYSHLPPMNDKNIVEKYSISFYWYQNKDLGRPESPSSYEPYAYDWRDGKWVYVTYFPGYYAFGNKGWRSVTLTSKMTPTTNKIGGAVSLNELDQALGTATTPYININYTLKSVNVTLDNVTNKKENEDVTLSWTSDVIQTNYEVRYTNVGITKDLSGTTAEGITIGKYTLKPGKLEYEVRVSNGYNWSEWVKGSIDILEHPIHLTLEPNKIAQNKDKDIVVMWSSTDPQIQFKLLYSGTVSGEIVGTTAKSHIIPFKTFGNGMVDLTLQSYNGYVWTEKKASFMAYGAPPNPVLTISVTYTTARPRFTWTATDQVSYRLQILKDGVLVLDSSDAYSSIKNHMFSNVLENNTSYTARLRIRNQYEIESEWVSKAFTVAFTELQKPNFDMFANDRLGTIMFNIYNAIGQVDFSYCEILRREYGQTVWAKIASNLPLTATYTDYTCRSGVLYEYKVRAIGTSGGYSDSEIELKQVSLRNTMISDTTNFDNYVVLIHNPKKSRVFTKQTHAMQYSGSKTPNFEFGEVRYVNMNISFTVDEKTLDKILDLYYNDNILLLRDNRGKKIYGQISGEPSAEDADFMKYTVSFNFTETNYIEGVLARLMLVPLIF